MYGTDKEKYGGQRDIFGKKKQLRQVRPEKNVKYRKKYREQ